MNDPVIVELAQKYQVQPTQITLAWHLGRGVGVVPGSKNPVHQVENITVGAALDACWVTD